MKLVIEMVSDLVCPWCWMGLRRFMAALPLVPELDVDLVFRPFELDPEIPAGGVDYKAYMKQKFGGDENKSRANTMREALTTHGAAEGVPFHFDRITRRPNTFDAHRLLHWAQGQGKGLEAKEALFSAFFSEGQDIGDLQVLLTVAAKIGLDPNITSDLLASDADSDIIRNEMNMFRQMGISGVPTFVAHRRIAAQGAETPEKIAQFLQTAANQTPAEG